MSKLQSAFPVTGHLYRGESQMRYADNLDNGMTLRDYFAAKAMTFVKGITSDDVAENAYEMADAMIRARQRVKKQEPAP